jgi:hypothetical protein
MTTKNMGLAASVLVLVVLACPAVFGTVTPSAPDDNARWAVPCTGKAGAERMLIAFTAAELGVAQGIQQDLQKQGAVGVAQDKKRFRKRSGDINAQIKKRQKAIDDVLKDRFK